MCETGTTAAAGNTKDTCTAVVVSSSNKGDDGLPAGAIVGIAIGAVVIACLLGFGLFLLIGAGAGAAPDKTSALFMDEDGGNGVEMAQKDAKENTQSVL